jgi:hypothetical protein
VTDAEAQQLDLIRRLGEELRGVFADERRAIGALDHAALGTLSDRKRTLADELNRARNNVPRSPEVRALFEAIRTEAQANAILARAATDTVRAVLGIESTANGYDRRANRTTPLPTARLLATY